MTRDRRRRGSARLAAALLASLRAVPSPAAPAPGGPVFSAAERAVSTWRSQAAASLDADAGLLAALQGAGAAPPVARCIKLNNYWCIKKAGWTGEIASDSEGHVAFASAAEGAAVAALLLKRYYVDFGRRSALAIVSRWAPAQCSGFGGGGSGRATMASLTAVAGTLRARWLASHSRGFAAPTRAAGARPRRSVVASRVSRPEAAPTIALGTDGKRLGEASRAMTLDALLSGSPDAPPSRSMLGLAPHRRAAAASPGTDRRPAVGGAAGHDGLAAGCAPDEGRVTAYATHAAAGIAAGPDGDLALFTAEGTPTPNLAVVMANMARVEIGPLGVRRELIEAGIADAFRPGRNGR